MKYYRKVFLILVPLLVILDQVTKLAIRTGMPQQPGARHPKIVVIDGFFNIVHVTNPGAAWGFLGDLPVNQRMAVFAVVTLLAFVMIITYYRALRPHDRVLAVGLSTIFAGAAGNFIDRLLYREVTDFLQFHISGGIGLWLKEHLRTSYWPAFNVADICINVGVGLFIVHVLILDPRIKKRLDAEEAAKSKSADPEPDPAG
jgi:signal peptidase II